MTVTPINQLGQEAVEKKGWLKAHKWLFMRRFSQLFILVLFLLGPWFGVWIVKGNLISSLTFDVLPLTDPYILLQTLFTGYMPGSAAIQGALIVLVVYFLIGGRVYCSWVCPINMVTDASMWLRNKLDIKTTMQLSRQTRYGILAMTLMLASVSSILVWEYVNPVTMVSRALVFGMGFSWVIVIMIFLFDTLISKRAWCGHLCPMGAFYSLLGRYSLIRVNAVALDKCDSCMECYAVCPEHRVIMPVLKKSGRQTSLIKDMNCTNCGRCIDICSTGVFRFSSRFNDMENCSQLTADMYVKESSNQSHQRGVLS